MSFHQALAFFEKLQIKSSQASGSGCTQKSSSLIIKLLPLAMAQNKKLMFSFFVFLVLIFGQEIQSIQGGNYWKLGKKEDLPKLQSPPAAPSVAAGDQSAPPPPPRHTDDFAPTATGQSPGIGHSLQN
ncbi:hypothetical protein QYF36_009043 [Acer negundo]|nr:hypothetical protein QYF36_009043 [Acer negundo]